jgi:MFS superfamily sulfate permease-like transporter
LLGLSSRIIRRPFQYSVHDVFTNLDKVKYPDIIMGLTCILLTIGCQKLKQRMEKKKVRNHIQNVLWFIGAAGNFFVVVFGIVVVRVCVATSDDIVCSPKLSKHCLTDEGHIPAGLKIGAPPSVTGTNIGQLAVGAVLVALIGCVLFASSGHNPHLLPMCVGAGTTRRGGVEEGTQVWTRV